MSPAIRRRLPLSRRALRGVLAGLALLSLLAWPVRALELQRPGHAQPELSGSDLASPTAWRQTGPRGVAALDASRAL